MAVTSNTLQLADYRCLAEFRYQIRRFLRFSEDAARKAAIETQQHQLLLAIKGLPPEKEPRIGVLAERLQLQHHSTVELANRLARGGYVRRTRDQKDRREVLLMLTAKGERLLNALSLDHRAELQTAGPELMVALWQVLHIQPARSSNGSRVRPLIMTHKTSPKMATNHHR